MADQAGKVYLVGSGPGDAAYLTVQAQELLSRAEVVVYDALVDSNLLKGVPEDCLKLNVGKRGGQPSTPQSEINQLLVDYCQQGKQVVRLKNGDPFIFGRAESEIKALRRAGCEYEVLPGLSSALVAPLLAGIPLTDPDLSQCFTVLTAHNPDSLPWVSLARMETLVILMGGRTLPEIVRRLRGHGRSPDTPVAIVRYAGRPDQQVWEGTLSNILARTAEASLAPCVIVIGEVVRLRKYIQPQPPEPARIAPNPQKQPIPATQETPVQPISTTPSETISSENLIPLNLPPSPLLAPSVESMNRASNPIPDLQSPIPNPQILSHKTVLVTRAASQSSQFTTLLQEQGARVIEMPTLEIGPPSSWRELDDAIAHLEDFDWLILTSTNGVDYFFERLKAYQDGDASLYCNIRIAVVGEKTAQRLAKWGVQPDFIPPNFIADSLVAKFPEPLSGLRILFPRVESGGREVLVKEFGNQGARVREVAAYESHCPTTIAPEALAALQNKAIDVITFASSKTVQNFCQLSLQADPSWQSWLEGVCIASIGPQTSKTCESLLGRVDVEATEHTLEGLTQAIVDWAANKKENQGGRGGREGKEDGEGKENDG
jgi:uroporphyrinogen III methyltransferase/synthase